jgi:hypothetical protein
MKRQVCRNCFHLKSAHYERAGLHCQEMIVGGCLCPGWKA